ncbi:hypothetical protein [Arthrobacter sp. RCC_34]|uniref:hypothetical protein n=1 Tax=Arthrobacter sp. RCC_34 TaxID=3239230 RepID=UPI0035256088
MVCTPEERQRVSEDVGNLLFQLITDITAAETAIFRGSSETEMLLDYISTTGRTITRLEAAAAILDYARHHGAGPYTAEELTQALPYDQALIDKVNRKLMAHNILSPDHR